jgi:phage tail sheath gpL-like
MGQSNPNLTSGQILPGFYGYVDFSAGAAAQAPNLKCLLWGFVSGSATATLYQPFRPVSQTDCNGKAGGAYTDLARAFNAAAAQPEAQGAEIWCMPVPFPSGGTASSYTFTVFVPGTNPSKAGTIQMWVASQQVGAVGYTTTDTATTIAASIVSALNALTNIPIGTATNSLGVITVPYWCKGTTGEDFPVRATMPVGGTGVNLAAAQLVFATNATGAGSVLINLGAASITTALAGGETPAQVATKVVAAVNASSFAVTAVVDSVSTSKVDLYFNYNQGGWDVRRIQVSVVTSTGLTVNAGSGATDGSGSASSYTYNGTLGAGAPSLTQGMTNLAAQAVWYRSWASPWSDSTTLGTMATNIEAGRNGSITGQKLTVLTTADFQSLTTDGAIPAATSPALTTSTPGYAFGWSPDCPVQALELSARIAVARAAQWISAPQKNWNRYKLVGSASAPILLPPTTPSLDNQNSALRSYGLSPWVLGASGNLEVVKGRTTSLAQDVRQWSWSCEAQASYHWQDLQSYLAGIFSSASLVRFGAPKSAGVFDAQSVTDTVNARIKLWENQGNYDGADALATATKTTVNQSNINRFDVNYAESPVVDLDQIAFTGLYMQPSV